ncbi:MAG: histidine kinase, partial [Actinomycetota bacterium]|nr:histidine kinase [Actinomycetota bacterium]
DTGEPRPLAPAVSVGAYRITQEALTNAAKHGAGSATVATEWDDQAVSITVTNPVPASAGAGHDVPAGGHGLVGMRERAVTNGGTLDAGPTASGFRVRARLPVVRDQRGGPT